MHSVQTRWLQFWQDWGWPILVAACVLLQPLGNSANLPMLILAIVGLSHFLRRPSVLGRAAKMRLLLFPFACLWLPMALSLTDAADLSRSLQTVLVFLLFPFMGLAILRTLAPAGRSERVLTLVAVTLTLWSLDGLLQAVTGYDVFGHPHIDGQLTGVFHPKQTLGAILAVFTPLFLFWLSAQARRHPAWWLLLPVYMTTILLSGKRSAWIMLGVAVLLYGGLLLTRLPLRRRLAALALVGTAAVAGSLAAWQQPHFRAKVETTAGLASLDLARADTATSYRLTIWEVGTRIFGDHWLNGIGPRAFRTVYPDYALPGDIFMAMNPRSGPTHPHQILLEIAVETGVIGLAGYALFWAWLLRELLWAQRMGADQYLAWLVCLAAALFPLDAGHALYDASFWGGISFWLLFMALRQRPGVRSRAS